PSRRDDLSATARLRKLPASQRAALAKPRRSASSFCARRRGSWELGVDMISAPVSLAADALNRDLLRLQHLVLQRVHAGGGLVDVPDERDRGLQDRLEPLLVLD